MTTDGASGFRTWLVLVMIVSLAFDAVAQNAYAPDPLIEASLYAARAREQSETCWRKAERWADKSVKAARRFRSASAIERDTASAFIARQEMFLADLRQRRQQGEKVEGLIEQALKQKRLQSAREFLDTAAGMNCEANYQRLEARWRAESAHAASLVADADVQLNQDPKRARKAYEKVRREVDAQYPGIEERIERARQVERVRRGGQSSAAKAVFGLMLGLAAAALGYVAVESRPNNNSR